MAGTEAEGIRAAIGEMIDAQDADDAGRLRSLLSERPDAVDIGTDVGEWRISGELLYLKGSASNLSDAASKTNQVRSAVEP